MSRDLTPYELYLFEKNAVKNGGMSLLDTIGNLVLHYKGNEIPYCTNDEMAVRKQYPQLGKFLNNFNSIYDILSKTDSGLEVLERCDKEIASFIATGKADENSFVIKWFKGELDSSFYHSDENDRLFLECMCKEAETLSLSNFNKHSLTSQIQSAADRISSSQDKSKEKTKESEHTF